MKMVILIILIIGFLGVLYFLIRSFHVYNFRSYIIDLIHDRTSALIDGGVPYQDIFELWDIINNISYAKMLYSFKPLKIEYWLTEEELKLLEYKGNNNGKI